MIEARNLCKYYDSFLAVDGVSFSIREGEITGLLGPNGAGKTTTMRMITGYFPPSSGQVFVGGVSLSEAPVAVKKMIGYLPESAPIYADMMVHDYLRHAAMLHGITDEKRITQTAEMCGLIEVMHKNVGELSKGYRQRVGLAHAMIHDPKILILDEPTSGLDPNQIIEIRSLIREIGKKKTVILSTHILPEVEATCDRVIIINKGTIVADQKTADLQKSFGNTVSIGVEIAGASFADAAGALKGIGARDVEQRSETGGRVALAVTAAGENDLRPAIFNLVKDRGWTLYELSLSQNSLEKVFKELTLGGSNE